MHSCLSEPDVGCPQAKPMNFRQKMIVLVLDVLMVLELGIAMAAASGSPETFTVVFLKTFFSLLIPTLTVGVWMIRRARAAHPEPA